MDWIVRFFRSSIGAKVLMAITGVLLIGFVLGHLVGNLQIFIGQDQMNAYAAMLKGMGGLLWVVRLGLLGAVVLHIVSGIRLSILNRQARPIAYRHKKYIAAKLMGRTMALSGVVVLAFIVFHLLHFTLGVTHPEHFALRDSLGRHDVYSMFVLGFQSTGVAAGYMVAVTLLGFHLKHGISSLFQSLGLRGAKYEIIIERGAVLLCVGIVLGNLMMPIAVLTGILQLPTGIVQ